MHLTDKTNDARNIMYQETLVDIQFFITSLENITAINSLCIYKTYNFKKKIARLDFLEELAWELSKPLIEFRSTIVQVPLKLPRRSRI